MSLNDRFTKLFQIRAVSNGVWLYALQFFNTVIPLFTLPYITRVLGKSQYGVFSIALNILGYLQVVIEYGFGMSATRKVALLDSNDKDSLNKLYSNVLCSRLIMFVLCIGISVVYMLVYSGIDQRGVSLLILDIGLVGSAFQLNWLFQGKQEMKLISIPSITARIITLILIFVFVKEPRDLLVYCFLYSASSCISSFIGIILAKRQYRIKFVKVKIDEILKELKSGWYVFTTQLSSKVFGVIGVTFLGIYASSSDVGIYSAVQKIPYMLTMIWSPISQILYPISSKKLASSYYYGKRFVNKVKKTVMIIFVAFSLLVGLFAPHIIKLFFGSGYMDYVGIIYPLLAWVIVGINNNFIGIQTFLGSGHDKEYSQCFQVSVICTVVFNFCFIYFWGVWGAAFAPLASELVLLSLLKIKQYKIEKNEKDV